MMTAIRQRGRVIPVELRTPTAPCRSKPKPASADVLRTIAAELRDMPRECATDRAELLLWLSRQARQIDAIALDGFEPSVSEPAVPRQTRQRLVPRPNVDARAVADAVFGKPSRPRAARSTTVTSRRGRVVKVETRRKADLLQMPLFPDEGRRP